MPDGTVSNDALYGASATIAGSSINAISVGNANRRGIKYAREAYDKSRKDSLEFWNMQNAYNSPSAQMARFKEAGLNPNLIYGQGNSGNAGAADVPQFRPPEVRPHEFGSGIAQAGLQYMNSVYDLRIKKAQADNLEAQNGVIRQDAVLRAAQVGLANVNRDTGLFNLGLSNELRDTSVETKGELLRQLRTNIDNSIQANIRAGVAQATSIQEAAERIKTMQLGRGYTTLDMQRLRSTIDNLNKDGTLKQLDINLRKMGITPGSPLWATVVGQTLNRLSDDPLGAGLQAVRAIGNSIGNTVRDFFTH